MQVIFHTSANVTSHLQVFALHPLYLSVPALAPSGIPADIAKSIEEARQELDKPAVDYERTLELKLSLARRIFEHSGCAEIQVSLCCRYGIPATAYSKQDLHGGK